MSQAEKSLSLQEMDGLSILQAIGDGRLPPPSMLVLMNMEPQAVKRGQASFICRPARNHLNPIGMVHGGYVATALDTALGCAVHSVLDAGQSYATMDLAVKYLKPILPNSDDLTAEGNLIHIGKRMGVAEARLTDIQGTLYAHATTTCMINR